MKKLIFILLIFSSIQLFSQIKRKKFNFQTGLGLTTELFCKSELISEIELNCYINKYFASSFSFNYTDGYCEFFETTHYRNYKSNLTLFISPFKNTRKNDFRAGYGISRLFYKNITNDDKIIKTGQNIVIEDNYKVNNQFIVGAKIFEQIYLSSRREHYEQLNTGFLIKLGFLF